MIQNVSCKKREKLYPKKRREKILDLEIYEKRKEKAIFENVGRKVWLKTSKRAHLVIVLNRSRGWSLGAL